METVVKYQCVKTKKCRWTGTEEELVRVFNEKQTKKFGLTCHDHCCPKCGGKSFYRL